MAITDNNFALRPGIINKQGCLPDPLELVCVEVPKVFDQCLIKRCLKFKEGPDTNDTDRELRSNPLANPKIFLCCRDFNIKILSINKITIDKDPNYKKIVIDFMISFYADFLDNNGKNCTELFEINRTEFISKFYFPDSIVKIASSIANDSQKSSSPILQVELVADCLDGKLTRDCNDCDVLDITLGFHLIVKCKIMVQLLIPAYGYFPVDKPCEEVSPEDPCKIFYESPVPKLYPEQKLKPLFSQSRDYDHKFNCNYENS